MSMLAWRWYGLTQPLAHLLLVVLLKKTPYSAKSHYTNTCLITAKSNSSLLFSYILLSFLSSLSPNKTQGPTSAHSLTACWQIQQPSYLCQAAISLISAGWGQRRTPPVCSAGWEVKLTVGCVDLISSAPPPRQLCVRLFVCMMKL